ncbi:MAG: hypothetical protein QOI99_241 [Actinomycetota bacterium]|jgi:hypothetical protein|nr:hypothetical protein [Actinomycetota bacterium]
MSEPFRAAPSAVLTDADKERLLRFDEELTRDPEEQAWRAWVDKAVLTGSFFGSRSQA